MKHQSKRYKLGRNRSQRAALWYNLVRSLVLHGKIVTTDSKAKSIIPIASKLISSVKNATNESYLSFYRNILAQMRGDEVVTKKIFEYSSLFKNCNGGYLSIIKLGQRKGDGAHLSCVMFNANFVRDNG